MKYVKLILIVWGALATFVVVLGLMSKPTTDTHIFCAYNRVFVEFDENGKRWGTIMLDYQGKPIPCTEDNVQELPINTKEII